MTCDVPGHDAAVTLARVLQDLDRCPHGRHEGDPCVGWRGPSQFDGGCRGGISLGNPNMRTSTVVGYGLDGSPIVMPDRWRRGDPTAWRGL